MNSIISYPDRGTWGNAKWRGNCSGHVIKDLLEHYKPKLFVEVFSGGGTGEDVAKEIGIKSIHLDLVNGWDALVDEMPQMSDFAFSHPPYFDIIDYNTQRGSFHENDLSNKVSYEQFIKNLDIVNQKIYNSLVNGGRHAFLCGDVRKKGKYYSIIKDMAWFGNIESHIIKTQHNCVSSSTQYSGNFIPIVHEHLLIFRKDSLWFVPIKVTKTIEQDIREQKRASWRELLWAFLSGTKGASIEDITEYARNLPRAADNNFIRDKVRQTLNAGGFLKNERGLWLVA